jgi:hypothetical protein
MKHFVVYNPTTGSVLRSGVCQDQDFDAQAMPGEAVMEATSDAVIVAEVNLDPLRAAMNAKIDREAEEFRLKFITPGAGQAVTYIWKSMEAQAWLADPNAPVPIIEAEATATGSTVAAVVAEVTAAMGQWKAIGALIEGARRGAKKAVAEAANVSEIHAAGTVNWLALIPAT